MFTTYLDRTVLVLGVSSPDPSVVSIVSSFEPGGALPWSWALKLVCAAVTLASSFKGGEVTPRFFFLRHASIYHAQRFGGPEGALGVGTASEGHTGAH